MKLALALAAASIATIVSPAAAQSPVKPTALLFNGLAQYQPGFLTAGFELRKSYRETVGFPVVRVQHL